MSTTPRGARSRCPAIGGTTPTSPRATGRCSIAARSHCPSPTPGGGAGSPSTASSTRPTSGSTAPTSAIPRGTSFLTHSTSRHCRASVTTTSSPRGRLHAPDRTIAANATSPASSSTGMASTATGTQAASGVRSTCTTPDRSVSTGSECSVATPTRPAPTYCSTPASTAIDRSRSRSSRGSTGSSISESERRVAGGLNDVSWSLDIADPALWWPRALGQQPLTDVEIDVLVGGEVSDHRERRTGLRVVAWNNWSCSVNGERLFLKGANLLPTKAALADATVDELQTRCRTGCRGGARRAPRPWTHRAACRVRRCRRARRRDPAGLPAPVGIRAVDPGTGGRAGPRCGRRARAPSVDRVVERAQRPDGRRDRHRGRHDRCPRPLSRRPSTALMEQVGARSVGEAIVRARRPDPAVRPPLWCAPPPTVARRHRQPLLLRLVPRRRPRHRGARSAGAPGGALPLRVRGTGGSRHGRLHRRRCVAGSRLGRSWPFATGCRSGCSTSACRPTTSPPSTNGASPLRCTRPN